MKRVQDKTVRNAKMNQFERKKHLKSIGKTFCLIFLLAVIGIGFLFGNWVLGVLGEARELDVSLVVSTNTTQILDRHGTVVRETGTTREWVSLNEISPVMIDAILAIEDARFFEHYGVDWTRTLGAQVINVETFIHGTGGLQGGSTLTQQLINQTHLLSEDGVRDTSIERKLQEMLLSFQIERVLSKDQILEAYLNYSPFGGGIYGIQAAAEFYFGVNASQLTLSQAATLAGLVQAPNDWRPDWNAHLTENRRNEVLDMMERHGYITATLRDLAAAEPITDMLVYYTSVTAEENAIFNDYINHVLNEAYERWGINAHEGYIIETHLDPDIQKELVLAMMTNERVWWPDDYIQSAVSVIETQTGIIRGLAGRDLQRHDYEQNRERGFVMATDITQSIGSTSKPIWAYGPAMEHLNWGAGTMLDDDVFAYQDGMLVRNWTLRHEGRVTMRQAMAPSWNPPALQAFNAVMNVDSDVVADFVLGLGIPEDQVGFYPQGSTRDNYGTILEAYAIGGNDTGMAPIHLAGAYAAFGNTGYFNEPRAIKRIIAPDGTIYYEPPGEEPFRRERVMREETAYMMTDVLRTTVTNDPSRGDLYWATGTNAHIAGWFVAAKTGTTNFDADTMARNNIPSGGVPDVWIAGYTQEFTMSIWVGHESLAEGRFLYGDARELPNHLFREIMSRIEHENPAQRPERPTGIIEAQFELMGGTEIGVTCSPSAGTPGGLARTEMFFVGYGPSACPPTAFSTALAAPTNFSVSASGATLNFSWDAGTGSIGSMTLSQAEEAAGRARAMAQGLTHMTDALRNLNPTEGQAMTIARRIRAGGGGSSDVSFSVIATLADGGTRELVSTTETSASYPMLASDINEIRYVHVVARRGGSTSDPSNVESIEGLIDSSALEIVIPDMEGWTLSAFQAWANDNGIIDYTTSEAHSNTVAEGHIITTNPTGTMSIDQRIRITISLGAREDDEGPDSTPSPDQTPDSSPDPDGPGGDDPPGDWCDEDDPLCDLVILMAFINQRMAILPRRENF